MKDTRSELVRIDASGVIHPIGTVASQRLRSRSGAYRLLPAPGHIVFMRFTGEDGRRDAADGAIVRLSGEITTPGAMCDVFALVGQTGWRGELVVLAGETERSVFFEHGNVVAVQTNVEHERIGMILYKFGLITEEQQGRILDRVKDGQRYGAATVELGILSQDKVYGHLGRQIEEVVFAMLTVADGTFFFLDDFDDARLTARHMMSASALLMDAVTRMDEMRYFREKIPSGDYVPERTRAAAPPCEEYRATYDVIDGRLSVHELGRATGRGEFATTKDVYALLQSKHVVIHPPKMSGGLVAIVATANEALRGIHEEADRASLGAELRQSLSGFAVGAGVYGILFRGAGPDDAGTFDPEKMASNTSLLSAAEDPQRILTQMLYDYIGFAIFSLGGMLGEEKEAEISRRMRPVVGRLQSGP